MSCTNSCRLCRRLVISQSITFEDNTLIVDLPSRAYNNGEKYCIIIAQAIPTDTTISSPVAFSIGGDTETLYPFVKCDCSQITACGIRTRTRYATVVSTNATSGVFKSLGGISCYPINNLESLPAPTVEAVTTTTNSMRIVETPSSKTTKTVTTTRKEVVSNE